jgi:hypothetical protein
LILQRKILDLKLQAAMAARHATFWQHAIDVHGEDHATAFYTHLGLNHLPAKSFDYDGLTLSREPKVHEALQVKAIAAAQDSAKERLTNLLLVIRNVLVEDALAKLGKLSAATYHKLIVTVSDNDHDQLHDAVTTTFNDGRLLIAAQRGVKADDDDDFEDELDRLTSITASRLANDVQARITGAAARFALLGQSGGTLVTSVTGELRGASTAYVERAATGLANRTINLGRSAEAARYDWQRVEYSALLDVNTCGPCLDADGQEASDEAQLTPAPNPDCEGYDSCRCFHVFVQD